MKNWTDKLNDAAPHVLKRMPINIAGMKKGELALVPSVRMIDAFIRKLKPGRGMSIRDMRKALARRYKADVTCPVYTGYHLRTVAETTFEQYRSGVPVDQLTPIWRVIDETTPTWKKLSEECAELFRAARQREAIRPAVPPSPAPRGRQGRSR